MEACEQGTVARYVSLEKVLAALAFYELFELTEEVIIEHHPLSDDCKDDSSVRQHFKRFRDNVQFHGFAFKKMEAKFGGARKIILFMWKVPVLGKRTESADAAAVATVAKRVPELHSRAVQREFVHRYGLIAGVPPMMLHSNTVHSA